jgi:shikimate dehydrogenase
MFITGIIGYPLKTTVSPALHNAAFKLLGMNGLYLRFPVKKANLHAAVCGLHALGFAGVNVTIPYKERIIGLVHQVVGSAQEIGAVNTIVNHNDTLYGYNTDIYGFQQSLEDYQVAIKDRQVLLLGAGGAGHACAYVLQHLRPKKLIIADRVLKRARACSRRFNGDVVAVGVISRVLKTINVVVNATPANLQHSIVPHLQPGAVYYDINYTYRMMKRKGIKIINGLRMLVLQGAQSFCLWTGHEMPVKKVMQHVGLKL